MDGKDDIAQEITAGHWSTTTMLIRSGIEKYLGNTFTVAAVAVQCHWIEQYGYGVMIKVQFAANWPPRHGHDKLKQQKVFQGRLVFHVLSGGKR